MNPNYKRHFPVMLSEVLEALAPADGKTYVDATFGNGGYSEAVLEKANCKVIALDRDPTVSARAEELKAKFGSRFDFRAGQFGDFAQLVTEDIDGAVLTSGSPPCSWTKPNAVSLSAKTLPWICGCHKKAPLPPIWSIPSKKKIWPI